MIFHLKAMVDAWEITHDLAQPPKDIGKVLNIVRSRTC